MNDANKSRAGTTDIRVVGKPDNVTDKSPRSNLQAASVPISQEYQKKAAECLRLAHAANDLSNKALLLELAQAWLRLEQVPLKWNQHERHARRGR
jgi:hypothetical protein